MLKVVDFVAILNEENLFANVSLPNSHKRLVRMSYFILNSSIVSKAMFHFAH